MGQINYAATSSAKIKTVHSDLICSTWQKSDYLTGIRVINF